MGKIYLVLVVMFLLPVVSAQYISGDIYIYENGVARFSVEADFDPGIEGIDFDGEVLRGRTNVLTSMQGGVWTFTLSDGEYETIFLDIHLPRNIEAIVSIEGVENVIDFENKIISLIGEGELDFEVKYKLGEGADYSIFYFLIILILLIVVIYLFFRVRKKRKKKFDEIFPLINDNEKKIIEALMKRSIRQKELRKKLEIPKASFSRYVLNLEKKKLIVREGEGKNRIVRLK